MRNVRYILVSGLIAGGLAVFAGGASAGTVGSVASPLSLYSNDNPLVQEVQSKRRYNNNKRYNNNNSKRYSNRYSRSRHGSRYRERRHGYSYYHDGYYYAQPWWLGAAAAAGIAGAIINSVPSGGGSSHVAWCSQRFRSYNPATDTYTGYDGLTHRCNSPY